MGSDLTGEGGAAAYSGLEVVAGDDEDGGAASVAEGTAATAVLGVGEEDGEVRRVEGVAKVVAACVGDVWTGRGEDGGARSSGEMRTATTSGRGGVGRCGTARMEEGGLGLYIGEGRASGSSGISSIPRASAGGFGSACACSSCGRSGRLGKMRWSGAHQSVAAAVASEGGRGRSTGRKASGAGAGLGPNGQWAGWPGALARRARPWAELVSVQAGECVRCVFLTKD